MFFNDIFCLSIYTISLVLIFLACTSIRPENKIVFYNRLERKIKLNVKLLLTKIRDSKIQVKLDRLVDPIYFHRGYCLEPDIENLADYNYVIPFFLSVYLLIGNVMLLNLLIAIFTLVLFSNLTLQLFC